MLSLLFYQQGDKMINTSSLLGRYWISSISRLPMFYQPGSLINGMMCGDTGEEFFPVSYRVWTGRNICIHNFHKYKLEIETSNSSEQPCDTVGVSDTQFDIHNVKQCAARFFPIYMRCPSGCYLFVQSINELFKTNSIVEVGGVPYSDVVTPYEFCKLIADLCCVDLMPHDPILDSVARIQQDWLITELIACAQTGDVGGAIFESMLNDFSTLTSSSYIEILKVFTGVRTTMDISALLNPYGSIPSDVSEMCNRNFENGKFKAIGDYLNKGNLLPTFSHEISCSPIELQSPTGRWLSGVFMNPSSDYHFTIRGDYRDCSDYYITECKVRRNFEWFNTRVSQDARQLLDRIPISFDISKYGEQDYIAERSWLEDVVVRKPKTNEIILYLDLVVWILACAEGLINKAILSNASTMY